MNSTFKTGELVLRGLQEDGHTEAWEDVFPPNTKTKLSQPGHCSS